MRILAKEEHHFSPSESYNEEPTYNNYGRQTCGIPADFWTNSTQCRNSFLPQTIRDLKGQSEQTVSYSADTGLTPSTNTI